MSHRGLWIVPPLAFLGVFFFVPVVLMAARSLPGFSPYFYAEMVANPIYGLVFLNTFRIAAMVTAACVLLGYPIAYWLSGLPVRRANACLAFVLLPYFTSVLVRTYAWMVLLSNDGLINRALLSARLISAPIKLLYNDLGVLIGMTYVLLPYMILTMYAAMRSVDRRLLMAAAISGASPLRAFHRIFVPVSLHGVAGGCLLVFMLALGFFITPALMGGPQQTMISMLIDNQVEKLFNWGFASALSVALLALTLCGTLIFHRLVGIGTLMERRS